MAKGKPKTFNRVGKQKHTTMNEHDKAELQFKYEKFGTIQMTIVDSETQEEIDNKTFTKTNSIWDEVLQFIYDCENSGLTIYS